MKQLAVRTVSHDHQGLWQPLAHLDAPLLILIDDPHRHSHLQQLRGQVIANLAGTHNHHRRRPVPENSQVPEKLFQLLGGGGQVNFIS